MMSWKLYFDTIKCQEDYDKLKATGMAYELFPDFPSEWFVSKTLSAFYETLVGRGYDI